MTLLFVLCQGLHDIGAITNHMTEDTLNIMQFFWISHYAWAIPFKVRIGKGWVRERRLNGEVKTKIKSYLRASCVPFSLPEFSLKAYLFIYNSVDIIVVVVVATLIRVQTVDLLSHGVIGRL